MITEGFVYRIGDVDKVSAGGSRCVVLSTGELLCSFALSTRLGSNDFKPMLARSLDGGVNWSAPTLLWPDAVDEWSIFGAISHGRDNELLFYGSRWSPGRPGESFWCTETHSMKQNQLIWARSLDDGQHWSPLQTIPHPVPGSVELSSPLAFTGNNRLVGSYAPKRVMGDACDVPLHTVISVWSDNLGETWQWSEMFHSGNPKSEFAECWVAELDDGRLLGTGYHFERAEARVNFPNAFAISHDGGTSWKKTASTEIMGQSTGLARLTGGEALMVYNQRSAAPKGVWLAHVKPDDTNFGILSNMCVWQEPDAGKQDSSPAHRDWLNFRYGEPSVTVLPDNTLFVAFWCEQSTGAGIRFVKMPFPKKAT